MLLFLVLSTLSFAADRGHAPVSKTGGWEALSTLQTGNMRFYEGHLQHPNLGAARRELVAKGQSPHTIIVSCSDSRVPPEQIFDQGLGDIFSVRNAGNVMSVESIASIEYAIEHLGSRFLVVMGHESCGAVGAAVASVPGQTNGSESLDKLVRGIRGNLSSDAVAHAAGDKTFRRGVKENVSASLADLLKKSAIVREAVAHKGLVLGRAIYSLTSGRVEFWDVGKSALAPIPQEERVVITSQVVKEEVISPDPVGVIKKIKVKKPAAKSARH
jgi:carbonic anhydrase